MVCRKRSLGAFSCRHPSMAPSCTMVAALASEKSCAARGVEKGRKHRKKEKMACRDHISHGGCSLLKIPAIIGGSLDCSCRICKASVEMVSIVSPLLADLIWLCRSHWCCLLTWAKSWEVLGSRPFSSEECSKRCSKQTYSGFPDM